MMMKQLIQGELIGQTLEVIDASNKTLIGQTGEIIDETKNMLVIKNDDTTVKLIKDQIKVKINDKTLHGTVLNARPEERIKITNKKINTIQRLVKRNETKNKNKKPRNGN